MIQTEYRRPTPAGVDKKNKQPLDQEKPLPYNGTILSGLRQDPISSPNVLTFEERAARMGIDQTFWETAPAQDLRASAIAAQEARQRVRPQTGHLTVIDRTAIDTRTTEQAGSEFQPSTTAPTKKGRFGLPSLASLADTVVDRTVSLFGRFRKKASDIKYSDPVIAVGEVIADKLEPLANTIAPVVQIPVPDLGQLSPMVKAALPEIALDNNPDVTSSIAASVAQDPNPIENSVVDPAEPETHSGGAEKLFLYTLVTTHPWGLDHLGPYIELPEDYLPEDPGITEAAVKAAEKEALRPEVMSNKHRRGAVAWTRLALLASSLAVAAFVIVPGLSGTKVESPASAEPSTPVATTPTTKVDSTPTPDGTAVPIVTTPSAPDVNIVTKPPVISTPEPGLRGSEIKFKPGISAPVDEDRMSNLQILRSGIDGSVGAFYVPNDKSSVDGTTFKAMMGGTLRVSKVMMAEGIFDDLITITSPNGFTTTYVFRGEVINAPKPGFPKTVSTGEGIGIMRGAIEFDPADKVKWPDMPTSYLMTGFIKDNQVVDIRNLLTK